MQIYSLLELVDQTPFDLWRFLNMFLKLYPDMPIKLNNQFREIEIRIVCELAWKKGSSVLKMVEYFKKQSLDNPEESKEATEQADRNK